MFVVIDMNVIQSLGNPNLRNKKLTVQWTYLFPTSAVSAQQYHIQLKKHKHIVVMVTALVLKSVLYDGPGDLSKILTSFRNSSMNLHYKTTTFQTVVLLWITRDNSENNANTSFFLGFTEISVPKMVKMWTRSYEVASSSEVKTPSLFIQEVVLPNAGYINISILDLKTTGGGGSQCLFSGVSAFDSSGLDWKEISTVCFSYPGYRHQNIYSNGTRLLVTIYSYSEYGYFSTRIRISKTHCKPLKMNTCLFTIPCYLTGNHCNAVKTFRNVLSPALGSSRINYIETTFFTQGVLCLAVQFNHDPTVLKSILQVHGKRNQYAMLAGKKLHDKGFRFCRIGLIRHHVFPFQGYIIHHNITGFISCKYG